MLHEMLVCCQQGTQPSFAALQRDPNEWVWEPLALIGFLLFFRTLVYIALRKRTKASVR